jgi:hypothetical protein
MPNTAFDTDAVQRSAHMGSPVLSCDPQVMGGTTLRSSGAPVSVAAECPRRFTPRRPLNAIVSVHDAGQSRASTITQIRR